MTEQDLTLDEVLALLTAARSGAQDRGIPMSFAVVDRGGHLLGLIRMDGAPFISAEVCQGKAWTAAAYGAPSSTQAEKMKPMPHFSAAITAQTHGSYTPQDGGLPVRRGGIVLGGMGASGGTGAQDAEVVAEALVAHGLD